MKYVLGLKTDAAGSCIGKSTSIPRMERFTRRKVGESALRAYSSLSLACLREGSQVIRPQEQEKRENTYPDAWTWDEVVAHFPYPRPEFALYNYSMIPERDGCGAKMPPRNCRHGYTRDTESIFTVVEYAMRENGLDVWGYADGLVKAVERGQNVHLVMGLPEQDPGEEEITTYAREFLHKFRPKTAIFGNEIDMVDGSHKNTTSFWAQHITQYTRYYAAVQREARKVSPSTEVSLYGETFGGSELVRERVWRSLKSMNVVPDALSFHFYGGDMMELRQEVAARRKILHNLGWRARLNLTELGNPEDVRHDRDQARLALQGTALAFDLLDKKQLDLVVWSVALDPQRPHISLFREYERDEKKEILPRHSFSPLFLATRLLHHDVRSLEGGSAVVVSGKAHDGTKSLISWNRGEEQVSLAQLEGYSCYNELGERVTSDSIPLRAHAENVAMFIQKRT